MGISELRAFQGWIDSGDLERIDRFMEEWVGQELNAIRDRACTFFPARSPIINAALGAHQAKQYALSIPVLLIQTEGMCVDTFGVKLYSTEYGVPKTRGVVEPLIDSPLADVFLLPMREGNGLTASGKTRANFPDSLNRHEILHGSDNAYATARNSFKAISLMEYFVTLVAPR